MDDSLVSLHWRKLRAPTLNKEITQTKTRNTAHSVNIQPRYAKPCRKPHSILIWQLTPYERARHQYQSPVWCKNSPSHLNSNLISSLAQCNVHNMFGMNTLTHTHTRLTALCPGLPGWAGTRKVKQIWILLKQESEWQWNPLGHMQICTLLQTDNHDSIPPFRFLQAGCPSWCLANTVKALKATRTH